MKKRLFVILCLLVNIFFVPYHKGLYSATNINAALTENSSVKAVLFDCDGTLVNSEPLHYLSYKMAVAEFGGDLSQQDFIKFVGTPDPITASRIAKRFNIDDPQRLVKIRKKLFRDLCKKEFCPIEKTVNFLKSLLDRKSELKVKVGVCSAADKNTLMLHLEHLGVSDRLDVILSGEDDLSEYSDPEGVNKPKPYIYQHAAKLLNVAPEQCVVIEDSVSGVAAGVSAGCFTIAIPNEYTRNLDFSHAHLRLESFENVTFDDFLNLCSVEAIDTKSNKILEGVK